MKVISVNIATKTIFNVNGKEVESGILKKSVSGPIYLDYENVAGDTVSDRKYHGGVNKAVYGYSYKHYEYWRSLYEFDIVNYGQFGENITFDDLDEREIKAGNIYQCGNVIIEATEPRYPCFKLGLVFNDNKIIKDFKESYRCGVYFKVIQRGEVVSGDVFKLVKENSHAPTIADIYKDK